jgi:hypothetical protein
MLTRCSTEAGERVPRDVMASRDRNLANGSGHVVDGDFEETLRNLFQALNAQLIGDLFQARARSSGIKRLITTWSKYSREMGRIDPS